MLAQQAQVVRVRHQDGKLMCSRRGPNGTENFIKSGSRFPRLTQRDPVLNLRDIQKFLNRHARLNYRLSFLFIASIACLLGSWLYAQPVPKDLTHLGNGVAAIVADEIITVQQLRQKLEPFLPRLRVESKNQKRFHTTCRRLKLRNFARYDRSYLNRQRSQKKVF